MQPDPPSSRRDRASWDSDAVPPQEYEQIATALTSADSPVGIDAKHTHILILHALDRIEKRLARVEKRLEDAG